MKLLQNGARVLKRAFGDEVKVLMESIETAGKKPCNTKGLTSFKIPPYFGF